MPDRPVAASAIVCTLDRGPAIGQTIRSLCAQAPSGDGRPFEVLLVDNGSAPANAALLRALCEEHAPACRLVVEPERGLSIARNRGIREARGEFLVFVDDDAIAAPDLLARYVEEFARVPDLGLCGGRVRLHYLSPPPPWLDSALVPYLSAFEQGDEPKDLAPIDAPRGCNMAFRATVFERIPPFSDRFGRKGRSLLSGEEIEVAYRVAAAGWRIRYLPGASIDHLVDPVRFAPAWFARRIHWQGRSIALLDLVHRGRARLLRKLPWHLLRSLRAPRMHRELHRGYVVGALRGLAFVDHR
ncbi:MAG: glycosyltransferase [Planctomycetes bacterium]|nr:glycosyltransferase [Planctomycetota bacterium]